MYTHPATISEDVNVQLDLYRKAPCNFAGMEQGCWYHKPILEASDWVAPKFKIAMGRDADEDTDNAQQELEDESTHVFGLFRGEWMVIPRDIVVEDQQTQTQGWIDELEEDIRGYIDGKTSCMVIMSS